jgi:hypothetical protein
MLTHLPAHHAVAQRKRPLLPNIGTLLEEDDAEPAAVESRKSDSGIGQSRRSEDGATLSTGSPPHKVQKKGGCITVAGPA